MSDSSYFKLYLKKGLSQNLFIFLITAAIAFSVNAFRPDGLLIFGDWSIENRVTDESGSSLFIPISEAKRLYGENCDLSHELALFLKQMGFPNTRVLVNGWTVWQELNLPVEGETIE